MSVDDAAAENCYYIFQLNCEEKHRQSEAADATVAARNKVAKKFMSCHLLSPG